MQKQNWPYILLGIGIGMAISTVPAAIMQRTYSKNELELIAAYNKAIADWKASDKYHQDRYFILQSTVSRLQSEIATLEAKPPVMVETVKYIEIPVEIPVEIPKPYYADPEYFKSHADLRAWVDAWTYYDTGLIILENAPYDCDDFCISMVTDAAIDGKVLGYVLDTQKRHMLVSAIVGNNFYFIEPQNKSISDTYQGIRWVVD